MMSNPKITKGKNVKTRQAVMGDFFSKTEQSKKTTLTKSPKKTTALEKSTKQDQKVSEQKPRTSPRKAVEKNTVQTVGKTTKETVEKKSKAVEKKADKDTEKRASLKRKVTGAGMFSYSWTRGAQRDTEEYRNGYPDKKDYPDLKDNSRFYMNEIPSKPDGDFIDKIHIDWWGDYKLLEVHHGYIQWLFPIRESGLNWHAQELQLHEIKKLQRNKKAMKRILTSYKMMLDFYGMEIENEEDGTLKRGENWRDRFRHLNRSFHNYLRITRILKCLGEFGYEHLKKNFVKFVLYEGLEEGTLSNLIDSCVKYWIGVLKEDEEREEMFDYYEKLTYDENLSLKRRNRSPSPPSSQWSNWKTDTNTGKKVISKAADEGKAKSSKKNNEEFSDEEEDSTLNYAMSLIEDEPTVDRVSEEKKVKDTKRKEHEMSDSDGDDENAQEESQEMEHWRNEAKKANEEDIEGGSEAYDSANENLEEKSVSVDKENVTKEKDSGDNDASSKESTEKESTEKESSDVDCKEKVAADENVPKNDPSEKTDGTNNSNADTTDKSADEDVEKDTDFSDAKQEQMDTSEIVGKEPVADRQEETCVKTEDEINDKSFKTERKSEEMEKMETT